MVFIVPGRAYRKVFVSKLEIRGSLRPAVHGRARRAGPLPVRSPPSPIGSPGARDFHVWNVLKFAGSGCERRETVRQEDRRIGKTWEKTGGRGEGNRRAEHREEQGRGKEWRGKAKARVRREREIDNDSRTPWQCADCCKWDEWIFAK
eukprot:746751-Hanusia_phi.AAC.1